MQTAVNSWGYSSAIVPIIKQPRGFGNPYRQFTASVTSATPIFGKLMSRCYQESGRKAVGKETGKTSYIEPFNNTLRQRVGRLVRKTLSFSKKLSNHIGVVWYFVHHYNASLRS
jgi:insertion element IS1 protein InsB